MVTTIAGKSRSLTLREAEFIREYANSGGNACEAYRRAYRYTGDNADCLSARITARPHVREAMDRAARECEAEGAMDMRERRAFLAKVVRDKRRFLTPDVGQRIAAIREDAILAGERRTDGTQISLSVDVDARSVLASLRSGLTSAADATIVDLPGNGNERAPQSAAATMVTPEAPDYRDGGPLGLVEWLGDADTLAEEKDAFTADCGAKDSPPVIPVDDQPYVADE